LILSATATFAIGVLVILLPLLGTTAGC